MLLERTISQLNVGHVSADQAEKLGHLGYIQWLGALDGNASYPQEAMRAYSLAHPFIRISPAVAVFCRLLVQSTATPLAPLELRFPTPSRRGGARARRDIL